jgi:hypothetical protein
MLLAAVLINLPAFGQFSTGSLSGTVVDSTGAVVPHAKIVLTNQATSSVRESTSNGSGFFTFQAVQPATYSVTITAEGFTPWEEKDIEFTQAANITLPNIALQVGSTKQEVQVVAAGDAAVPTDTGQASQTLNQSMIVDLAIQGRDAAELIKIMPGMGMNNGLGQTMFSSLVTQSNTGPIGQFSAQGTQPYGGMTMTSDGANLLDPGNQGTQTSNINQNQIQEVTILTSAYGAEFAKGPITFQAIGKSGTSQFHGDAYLYARNGTFNSVNSLLNATGAAASAPQDSYYYPGGDFGGPVIIPHSNFNRNHDKLFFYAAYENMRQNPEGTLYDRFIPTSQMMAGNFSPAYIASLGSNFANGPFKTDGNLPCVNAPGPSGGCTAGLMAPGGMIPTSALDPNSLALWKTYPAPNISPQANPEGANYQFLEALPVNRWELRLRGDYNINEKTKVFFSWNRQDETDLNPISVWWQATQDLPYPSEMPANQVSNVYSANVTHIFSPTLTNEFVFADATFLNPIALSNPAAVDPAKVGFSISPLFADQYTPQIPNSLSWTGALPGYFAPTFGQSFEGGDFGKLSQTPNISDNISKVLATHTLKFGFYWDFARNWQANSNFTAASQGVLEYETYGANSTNNTAADFATGRIESFTQQSASIVEDLKYHQYSFYANDQWKVNRRLTLTLGIRFDHMGQWAPASGPGFAVFDPAAYNNTSSAGAWTGLEWHAIDPSIPVSGFPSRAFFYEPRFGLAYDIFGTGKTVIRGGFGIYRYQLSANDISAADFNAPLGVETESTTWTCCIGYNSFNQFSPSLGLPGLGSSVSGVLQEGDSKTPYTETYNFTISQRGPMRSLIEVQYSGNQTHDSITNSGLTNLDVEAPGAYYGPDPLTGAINNPYSSSFPTNDYLPLHNYTAMQLVEHKSYSNYNAFIASWQKQTGRLTFTTNYTFSKVMGVRDGYTGNGQATTLTDPFNLAANYGPLAYDHTNIFNAAYIINLPAPVHDNKFLAGVVNGWELSGITQAQSGPPLQPLVNGNLNATYGSTPAGGVSTQTILGTNDSGAPLLPILTCNPAANLKSGQYFNPNCFAPPAQGQFGPAVWPYIKGPAFFDSDLSLFKNFRFKERQNLQLRFEAFNFLNHPLPTFDANGTNADVKLVFSNSAGQLTQTNQNALTNGYPQYTTGRRVIEFGAKYSF